MSLIPELGDYRCCAPSRARLPEEFVVYVADQAHVPYGPRPLEQVRRFSEGIIAFSRQQGRQDHRCRLQFGLCRRRCNTCGRSCPRLPLWAWNPRSSLPPRKRTRRVVGVLATPATFQGALYASVVERFGAGVTLLRDTCPGLVEQIEKGDLDGPETRRILHAALDPDAGTSTSIPSCWPARTFRL